MWWGVLCAVVAALAYGLGSVLQAAAARTVDGGGAKPLIRIVRQWRYLVGLGLDGLGFLAQIVALRALPLFLVQAVLAASLAVTAVASRTLGVVLRRQEWIAVALVCAGLALLGLSAQTEGALPASLAVHIGLPIAALVLGILGWVIGRSGSALGLALLGLVAGLCFGIVAVSARVVNAANVLAVLEDPAAYAAVLAGVLAMVCYAAALQRGRVTSVTATMVLGETVLPALFGVVYLGDTTRPGFIAVAIAGFLLAVAASLALARFGEVDTAAKYPPRPNA